MVDISDFVSGDLRHTILHKINEPVIFSGLITDWKIISWNLEHWAEVIGGKKLPFRAGSTKPTQVPQWEHECHIEHLTMEEFIKNCDESDTQSPHKENSWWYFDYKHMHKWFQEYPDILETVNWGRLGFPERGGTESTLWLGSRGSHTPCHLDAYGCNLVAQIFGRKQWYLFPPTLTEKMQPTRIPYEESSIFSKHNFYCPSVKIVEDLTGVRVMTLEPGQVLLVPRHWWHYVENLETAISINTWLPLSADEESRIEESLVRLLIAQGCKNTANPYLLLNPSEADLPNYPLNDTLVLVQTSLDRYLQNNDAKDMGTEDMNAQCINRKQQDNKRSHNEDGNGEAELYTDIKSINMLSVPICPFQKFQEILLKKSENFNREVQESSKLPTLTLFENCLNAFCHPTVIKAAKDKLLESAMISKNL